MNTTHTLILVAVAAIVTIMLRAIPFIIFNGKNQMPAAIKKVVDALPPAIISVLVVYCIKDYVLVPGTETIAAIAAIIAVALVHLWKKNTLFSIALGTVIYMVLIRII